MTAHFAISSHTKMNPRYNFAFWPNGKNYNHTIKVDFIDPRGYFLDCIELKQLDQWDDDGDAFGWDAVNEFLGLPLEDMPLYINESKRGPLAAFRLKNNY
jgi:hypothetical protein